MLTPRTLREPEPEPRVSRERELGMGGMRVARYVMASLLLASASGFSLTNKPLHGARRSISGLPFPMIWNHVSIV